MADEDIEHLLVCAREEDEDFHIRGCIGGYKCSECKKAIVVALSGQRWMEVHPGGAMICTHCALRTRRPGDIAGPAPGAVEELIEDLKYRAGKARTN